MYIPKKIFTLIGSPVSQSIGHIFHNKYFEKINYNAIYTKLEVQPAEISNIIPILKRQVSGLSVTMPLKECIIPYLDIIQPEAKKIGAVNTVIIDKGLCIGANTDGLGAILALETAIQHKHIAILGAGGAARAIIYTALNAGAKVYIFNRNIEKAKDIAKLFDADGAYALPDLKNFNFDILINTLPNNLKIDVDLIKSDVKIVMDISSIGNNSWLYELALAAQCKFIDKIPMFEEQAKLQLKHWGII